MESIIRTSIVLAGWLAYATSPNATLLGMAIFLTAGVLYQLAGRD